MSPVEMFKQFEAKDWTVSAIMLVLAAVSGLGTLQDTTMRSELREIAYRAESEREKIATRLSIVEGDIDELKEFAAKSDRVTNSDMIESRKAFEQSVDRIRVLQENTNVAITALNITIADLRVTIGGLDERVKFIERGTR